MDAPRDVYSGQVRPVMLSRFGRGTLRLTVALGALASVTLGASRVEARKRGIIATECTGCHVNEGASVEVTASPAVFAPGDDVTFIVAVRRLSGTAAVGGVSITLPATGEVHTLTGEGLTLVVDSGLTHSEPKTAVNGVATFRFGWRAPAEPGGVVFNVAAIAGNGDGRNTGDVAGLTRYLATFGCDPVVHYADNDRDGHGTELFDTSIGCVGAVPPLGFSTVADDCDDNDQTIFPGALEKCNRRDDDCDTEVDEDAELVELWPDEDGDGYYRTKTGTSVIGCSGMIGYAAEPGDCAPDDPAVHAGATEICNLIDDNCDGRPDERVRPQCGIGRCRQESYDCDPAHCTPDPPIPERCNLLDDDCNDEVDDGDDLCPAGSACLAGKCVATEGAGGGAGGPAVTGGAPAAGNGGQGNGGSAGTTGGGTATGGVPPGSGGVPEPGTGGSSSGSTGSGATGGASGGVSAEPPVATDPASGCAIGIRPAAASRCGFALVGLCLLWFGARRRRR